MRKEKDDPLQQLCPGASSLILGVIAAVLGGDEWG